MKKKALLLLSIIFISFFSLASADTVNKCGNINTEDLSNKDLTQLLADCNPKGAMEGIEKKQIGSFMGITLSATTNEGYKIENAKLKILAITNKAVILATLIAIGGLVYAGIMFTTAYGNNDKIKKAKESIKWSLIGLVIALVSQQLINALINLVYGISG